MSKADRQPIENAEEVIEKFGGIRPMAKKMDVAVTTVQGWKKRNVIPAARYQDVIKAAAENDVDLSGLLPDAPPVKETMIKNTPEKDSKSAAVQGEGAYVSTAPSKPVTPSAHASAPKVAAPSVTPRAAEPLDKKFEKTEKQAIAKSTWINIILLFIAVCALLALIWPQNEQDELQSERLSALEENVQQLQAEQEQQGFMGALIPENLDEQIASLKDHANAAQQAMQDAARKAEEISNDVLAENAGTLEQRYTKLNAHMADIAQSPALLSMAQKLESWRSSPSGEAQLNSAIAQLNAVLAGLYSAPGDPAADEPLLESALQSAREQSTVLGETFEGVPQEDLKAAALLLGLSQFRSSLGRDNEAFDDDLQVLIGLVGDENIELKTALERLAPYSEQGVLTPSGLTSEFKTMAGDAVVASLKGEEVDVTERAKARMNEMFQVEKDGALVTGTDTQATLNSAQKMLEDGNLEGAINTVEMLNGPAAETAQPWLTKARVTLMAQKAKTMLSDMMAAAQGGQYIYNEDAGINVYKRTPFKLPPNSSPSSHP